MCLWNPVYTLEQYSNSSLLTYLLTYFLTYFLTYLFTYLLTCGDGGHDVILGGDGPLRASRAADNDLGEAAESGERAATTDVDCGTPNHPVECG